MEADRAEAKGRKVRCEACGAKVRIPEEMALDRARCPRCRSPLDGRVDAKLPKSIASYRITKRLAAGGMGVVYEGRPNRTETASPERVAIKILQDDAEEDENLLLRFEREGKLGMALQHPHLVRVLEAGEEDGKRYMVMELVDGQSLSRIVKRKGPLSSQRVITLMRQVLDVICYIADKGVVHRDLKPGNVLLSNGTAKVIDFGLAKSQDPDLLDEESDVPILTLAGDQLGTPSYMAPEQVEDSLFVTPATDVYGLAATAYFALSGRAPYEGSGSVDVMEQVLEGAAPRLRQRSSSIPEAMDELIHWCMIGDPSLRPTVDQVAAMLDLVEADPEDAASIRDHRRDLRFRPPWGLLLGIAIIAVIGIAAVICWLVLMA